MFEDILDYFSTNSISNVVGVIIVYFIVVIGTKLIKRMLPDKTNSHVNTSIPLSQHEFFQFLEDSIHYRIPSIQFENKKKKEIFTIYLKIIFKTIFNRYKIFLEDNRLLTYNNSELKAAFLSEVKATIEDYNGKARQIGIPAIVIDKTEAIYSDVLSNLVEETSTIIDNNYYQSNYAKSNAVLSLYKFSTGMLLLAAKKSFDSLNGELDKELVDMKLLSILL